MKCSHHPRCPGCPLLSLPYGEQLAEKHTRVARAFAPYLHLPEAPEVRPSVRTEAYRHRLKLPIHVTRNNVFMGLYDRKSRQVLHTPDCPVLADGLREAIPPLLEWLQDRRGIHSVDLRVSDATGALQLVLAVDGGDLHGGSRAARALKRRIPRLDSVAISVADPERKRVMGRDPRVIAGAPRLEESIGSTDYALHPGAFFQTDPRNAVQIHDIVREWVGSARTVLDLYAGVGAYARMLAPTVERVVAIEEVPAAARSAGHDAPPQLEVIQAKVEDVQLEERFDVAILNPARRGCAPSALAHVATLTDKLIMVSCGPESLARDLDVLSAHGMRVVDHTAVDLFPQTAEVETLVLLERGKTRRTWEVRGGRAGSPWLGHPSGAIGRPDEVTVLAIGELRGVRLKTARWHRIGRVAGHSLLNLELDAPLPRALQELTRAGHPIAGADPKTRRFFADKALLVRPFVHIRRAGRAVAPLHGDLWTALRLLRADSSLLGLVAPHRESPR